MSLLSADRVIVIGASAGGIDALRTIVGGLPADFPAAICVVVHTSPQAPGILDQILTRAGALTASKARSGERLEPGHIFVAPPDYHLVVEPGVVRATKGPRENRFRPAVDPLFRSAAQVFGPAAIGVVLTGNMDDGTAGLWAIRQLGGITVVQDPADAMFPSMPLSALNAMQVDHCVPLSEIAPLLVRLTAKPVHAAGDTAVPDRINIENRIARDENPIDSGVETLGDPSQYACPDCHGVLLQLKEGGRIRFRCHTGHAYSAESLVAAVSEGIEHALWNAIRTLEEGGILLRHLAEHLRASGNTDGADRYAAQSAEARDHSEAVRDLVKQRSALVPAVEIVK